MSVRIQKSASLKNYNTFGVDVIASEFANIKSVDELEEVIRTSELTPFILGGGSNLLLTKNLNKLVLKVEIDGIDIVETASQSVIVKVGAGVVWHDFVLWAVNKGYAGIENLALIPGRVGAAPIQNIGAYGVEVKSVVHSVEAVDITQGETKEFNNSDCGFGYRSSVFKEELKGKYCITNVYFKLCKETLSDLSTEYGAIKNTLAEKEIVSPSIRDIANVVIEIRSSKLPDPKTLGNSGSFFKNPLVSKSKWEALLEQREDLVYYTDQNDQYKIPAGWLIDQCGWKGKRVGNVGCYEKQALVIVNYGGASGQEILEHSIRVQESVMNEFGIQLIPEVNIL